MKIVYQISIFSFLVTLFSGCDGDPVNKDCTSISVKAFTECGGCGPTSSVITQFIKDNKDFLSKDENINWRICLNDVSVRLETKSNLIPNPKMVDISADISGCVKKYSTHRKENPEADRIFRESAQTVVNALKDTKAIDKYFNCIVKYQPSPSQTNSETDVDARIKDIMKLTTEGLLTTYPCMFLNIARSTLNKGCNNQACSPKMLAKAAADLWSHNSFKEKCNNILLPQVEQEYGIILNRNLCDKKGAVYSYLTDSVKSAKITEAWFNGTFSSAKSKPELQLQRLFFIDSFNPMAREQAIATLMEKWIELHQFSSHGKLRAAKLEWEKLSSYCRTSDCSSQQVTFDSSSRKLQITDNYSAFASSIYQELISRYPYDNIHFQPVCASMVVKWNDILGTWETAASCDQRLTMKPEDKIRCFGSLNEPPTDKVNADVNNFINSIKFRRE